MVTYELPDGTRIQLPYDLTHGAFLVGFTLSGGRVVDAIRVSTRDEIAAAYRAWQNR